MLGEGLGALYLLAPLLGGAALHGACMRCDALAFLRRPIDGGRTCRGRRLFGASKTWRGPVLVAAGAAPVWWLQQHVLHSVPALAALEPVDFGALPGAWFGALAGFVAELGELPNSFAKRQLDIGPGETTRGPLAALFFVTDQVDVVLGFWLALAWVIPPRPGLVAGTLVAALALHPVLALLGYALGMRKTKR